MPITIRGRENGPFMIPGPAECLCLDGETQVNEGKTISLCRCGGSDNKPFCDGTHRRIEFQAPLVEVTLTEAEAS